MRCRRALAALLFVLPLVLGAQTQTPVIEFVRFTPVAIWGDGADSSTIEVRVAGSVTSVAALTSPPVTLDLFDDGTHGDARAGDQIFSRSGITYSSAVNTGLFPQIRITPASGGVSSFNPLDSRLWVVAPSQRIPVFQVE
jgi:hypothetical protein